MRWFLVSAALVVLGTIILVSFASQAFDKTHLKKFKALNKCEGCDLSGADLSSASLNGADLSGVDLTNSNLEGASLSEASLSGADLSGANLKGAVWNEETIFPEGFEIPDTAQKTIL